MTSLMQLQDAGCWTDAATLAAAHLKGSDYARLFTYYSPFLRSPLPSTIFFFFFFFLYTFLLISLLLIAGPLA